MTDDRLAQARLLAGNYVEPYLGTPLSEAKAVKSVRLDGSRPIVELELGFPLGDYARTLAGEVERHLRAQPGLEDASVTVGWNVQSQAVQGQLQPLPGIRNVIAVASGKGGVGKSTTAVNLALALAMDGARVGLLDADIYGPNLPRMLGVNRQPSFRDGKILPLEAWGVRFMSMGLLVDQGEAVVWRGPMLHGAMKSFLHDVDWGELDYLLVDLPPGTGDVQLSLIQQTHVAGAVVVTTPSTVAIEDAVKAVSMFKKLEVPVLGVIENMSYFLCPSCSSRHEIFNSGDAETRARELGLPFLGAIPLHPDVRIGGDHGRPVVIEKPDSEYARCFARIAGHLAQRVSIQTLGVG